MTRKKEEILNVCVTGSGFKPEVDDIEAGGTNIAFQSANALVPLEILHHKLACFVGTRVVLRLIVFQLR
jgi:hypothetical protein